MSQILAISSRVVRGTVGNTLASFVLQRMGHAVWEVPTVLWDRHPGFGPPSGLTLSGAQLSTLLADFRGPEQASRTDLVMTGYFAAAEQVEAAVEHIRALRAQGSTARVVCDPVCGDAPGLYVAPAVLEALRNYLVPLADVLVPNRHELGFVSSQPVTTNAEIVAAARSLGRPLCLVTSAHASRADRIGNLLVTPVDARICEVTRYDSVPNGTGDLLTALLAGWLAGNIALEIAAARAAAGVERVLQATRAAGARELAVIAAQEEMLPVDGLPAVTALVS